MLQIIIKRRKFTAANQWVWALFRAYGLPTEKTSSVLRRPGNEFLFSTLLTVRMYYLLRPAFFCIGWDIWNFSLLILFARSVLGLCRVKNILQSHMCCLCSCEWVQDGPRVPEINKWRLYIHAVALLSWLVPVIQVLLTATHFCADTVRLQFHPQRQERSKLRQHALLLLSEHACLAYGASIVSKPNQKFHA